MKELNTNQRDKCSNDLKLGKMFICIMIDEDVFKTQTTWTSSERLMYVQFTSCVYGNCQKQFNVESVIQYVRKIFQKTNISPSCAYQGIRNVSFPENFSYILNERSLYLYVGTDIRRSNQLYSTVRKHNKYFETRTW